MQSEPRVQPKLPRLRFDRHELAGAFGDIGTDLPLIIALIAVCRLDAASVCITFGLLQIATGILYGIPMPVQPLKAMASIMLAQRLSPGTLFGGGLVIGMLMLTLAFSGLLDPLVRVVPKAVVRGIQLALGMTLASLGLKDYAGSSGISGYLLAAFATLALLLLRKQKRYPAPLLVMTLGAGYALFSSREPIGFGEAFGLSWVSLAVPSQDELLQGALLLALPQLPLSLGNSVIATHQASNELYPEARITAKRIGITYGLMNLVAPWLGGIPVCHGCGGLLGFHGFGARTGGAPVLYGLLYLILGLFFAPGFAQIVQIFPLPILGVVLLFEAIALMLLVRDAALTPGDLWIALLVAVTVVSVPYGYLVGLLLGMLLSFGMKRQWWQAPGNN